MGFAPALLVARLREPRRRLVRCTQWRQVYRESADHPRQRVSLVNAWTFHTGDLGEDFDDKNHSFQASPVLWDRRLFFSTSSGVAFAINATTGEQVWRFDPAIPRDVHYSQRSSRGVALWHDPSRSDGTSCKHRVFLPTPIGSLFALDAITGKVCPEFGDQGSVDLRATALLDEQDIELEPGEYSVTSPPVTFRNLVIVGSALGDNRGVILERGVARALDANTGKEVWRFDPVPRRHEDPARSTWSGDSADRTGGANAWPPLSVDAQLGLVFIPTGSPSPDFYGGERHGDNRYANSLVALDADSGELVWSQQMVHHDVWDYDLPVQPVLVDLEWSGERIPSVVIATKSGMLFSFRRDNGEPVHPIEERPVPASDVKGERTSPTQPFSSLPALVSHKSIGSDDLFGVIYFDKSACEDELAGLRADGIFTLPSLQGTLMNPGWAGGVNWCGVAIDADRQIAVVNVNQLPGIVRLIPRDQVEAVRSSGELEGWQLSMQRGTPYAMARRMFLHPSICPA